MLDKMNINYFSAYSYVVGTLGLASLGCHLLKTINNKEAKKTQKVDPEIQTWAYKTQTWQNLLLEVPVAFAGFKCWKYLARDDPRASRVVKLLTALGVAVPTGITGLAVYILGGPVNKNLLSIITWLCRPFFPALHIAVISLALVRGKVSRVAGFYAMGVCLALLAKTGLSVRRQL